MENNNNDNNNINNNINDANINMNLDLNANTTGMNSTDSKKGLVVPLVSIIVSSMIIIISIIAIILILNKSNKETISKVEVEKVEVEKVEDKLDNKINDSEKDNLYEDTQGKVEEDTQGGIQEETPKLTLGKFAVTDDNTFSEEEVVQLLKNLGIYTGDNTQREITTNYDMDGNYFRTKEISSTSKERHPYYTFWYMGGVLTSAWSVSVIGREIMAVPIGYDGTIPDLIAHNAVVENDTMLDYNNDENVFIREMPGEDKFVITKIEKINAKTLDELAETKFSYNPYY